MKVFKAVLVIGVLLISTSLTPTQSLEMNIKQDSTAQSMNSLEILLVSRYENEKQKGIDILGVLYIPDIALDVVVKSNDNQYFINHDKLGNVNKKGELFPSKRSENSLGDMSLIYGHNNADGSKFGRLPLITNSSNNVLYFFDGMVIKTYELSFAFHFMDGSEILERKGLDQKTREQFIENLKASSFYVDSKAKNEDIVFLQTCLNFYGDERLVYAFNLIMEKPL